MIGIGDPPGTQWFRDNRPGPNWIVPGTRDNPLFQPGKDMHPPGARDVPGTADRNSYGQKPGQWLAPYNPPGVPDDRAMQAADTQPPSIVADAQKQWPILNRPYIHYKYSLQSNPQDFLEAWPPGETGTPDSPRPKEFPPTGYGIEIYNPKTRPIDVLGDVTSHFLVHTDPKIKDYYQRFQQSLTPEQQQRLQEQYRHAQQHEGEKRSFAQWQQQSGMPAYFRGYPFKQWPDAFNQKAYTPEQRKMLDEMMSYLKTAK